jgi:hypothetical protein
VRHFAKVLTVSGKRFVQKFGEFAKSITTLFLVAFSVVTFSITTFGMTAFSITTLSITVFSISNQYNDIQHNNILKVTEFLSKKPEQIVKPVF